jgi:hypothetical protein
VDTNRDLIFNDRPIGVERNSERGAAFMSVSGQVQYAIANPAGPAHAAGAANSEGRSYKVEIFANAQNITNHRNYNTYSGVMTSPFFHEPIAVVPRGTFGPRVITGGVRVNF